MNYAVARDRVLIRTDPGVKLAHAQFERVGLLAASDHQVDELSLAASRIVPWAGGPKGHVLVVTPVGISGRRIVSG